MPDTVLQIENLWKQYRLGAINHGTLSRDLQSWWARIRGKEDPNLKLDSNIQLLNNLTGEVTDRFWALREVSFDVKRGEIVGIIGRNGAGKSTLLKILSQVTTPTKGEVRINGRIASLLEVGTGFHPELTGRENVFLNGAILGMSKAEIRRKLDEIIAFAGIEKFIDTPVKRYSSGMYVRLAFAVAAHLESEILIVDEVLAVGDAQFQKKCLGKMEEVRKAGRTVLFVSHNMATVQRLCTKGILLDMGEIVKVGQVEETSSLYLGSNAEASYYWERSVASSREAYIKRVYLTNEEGTRVNYVETANSLRVTVEYSLRAPCTNIQISFGLLDDYGVVILGSSPQDAGIHVPDQIGNYLATITFPKDLLLGKRYGIRAVLWTKDEGVIDEVDELNFMVEETASLTNSISGGRAGVIALRCDWKLNKIVKNEIL